jgi:uncharacterized protein
MKTAIITGASGGIGLELARIFASKGVNLILVARNQQRLNEIATELTLKGVSVAVFSKDLSVLNNAKDLYNDIKSKGIVVDYLVNNAGFGICDSEIEIAWDRELEMLNLNMITLTYLTKVFALDMSLQGSGHILNVGSTGSFQPGPYMAGYCATKAYVLHFSEAVNYELKGSGVSVTTLCPGVTDTGFHTTAQTTGSGMFNSLSHASARDVAAYGYSLMMKGQSLGVYGFINKLQTFILRITPRFLVTNISGKLLNPGKKL